MILTNENNIGTEFKEVDILESFDDLFNRFPTGNSTSMPGLKIYGDNSDQSKAKNIKLYNNAQKWRDNFISYNGWSDTGQGINMKVDELVIYDTIWDEYDGYYYYNIDIYNDRIILLDEYDSEVLTISSDGSVIFNKFPTNDSTYADNTDQSKANNIELYNNAQEWRDNYIIYNGLSDTAQPIKINIDLIIIDDETIDEYNGYYYYHIDIYNDRITLLKPSVQEVLTISSDGLVTIINPI